MLSNFHCHSNYCDGTDPIEAYIQEAINLGLSSIGISSHSPLQINNTWSMKAEKLNQYLQEIDLLKNKYASQIQVYKSLEIDYIPNISNVHQFENQLDYTLASVHYAGQFNDGTFFEVDGSTQLFKKGIQEIYNNNINQFLETYFKLIQEMVEKSTPQIVGHIDKIKIHNEVEHFWNENDSIYQTLVNEILDLIASKNILVEINTRGLYKKKSQETYPGVSILKLMKSKNIGVVINSDSHHPRELISNFDTAKQNLISAGYTSSFHFYNNAWIEVGV